MNPSYLVTHSGGFHADELLSSVVLTRLFPQAQLVRSRDADWITPAPDRVIYDVGRDYNPELFIFDHHQREAPLREDGQPLSSFGLIWRHYGRDYLRALSVPEADLEVIHASCDTGIVLAIDLTDNGALSPASAGQILAELTLPAFLEGMKPVFDDPDPAAEDRAFHTALPIARAFLESAVARKAAKARAEGLVMASIAAAGTGVILELSQGMPFQAALKKAKADHILFVVTPRGGDWTLGGIRKSSEGFELRADLPAAWAGLTDAALEEVTGVRGAKFCHNGRFIAVADSREAIMAMAEQAVVEAARVAAAAGHDGAGS